MDFELEIIHWLQSFRNGFLDFFFQFWTYFGEELIIIAVLGFLYWVYDKKIGEKVGITVFISFMLNAWIKILVARLRPFQVDDTIANIRPQTSEGYSFPSGHTQGSATVFGSLAYWMKKRWITIVSIIIIVMVAISRMYLGVHYFTDVVVGGLLGIGIAIGMGIYLSKHENTKILYEWIANITIAIAVFSYFYFLFRAQASFEATNATVLYNNLEGLFKMVGLMIGFLLGLKFEKKYVQFETHRHLGKNAIRFVLGIGVVMIVRVVLKVLFGLIIDPESLEQGQLIAASVAALFDLIRYGAMVFVGIGVYPLLFKKVAI